MLPSEPPRPRFVASQRSHTLRVALGANLLIGAASGVFAMTGRLGSRGLIHHVERSWARATARLLRVQLDISGREHIDPRESYAVVSLHEGMADALALLHLGLPLRFMVRDELFEWPSLGRYLEATDQIRVDEDATTTALRSTYRQVEAAVASGDSIAVFAQGSILGVEVAFRPGVFRIARRFGLPLLPIVVTGTHRVWEHPYTPTVRLDQRVSVRILPPLAPEFLDKARMRTLEREMKTIALSPSTAPVRRFDPDRDGWWDGYRYEIDPDFGTLASRIAQRRAITVRR